MSLCEVCRVLNRKYKCPKCYLCYCSVPCFKKHADSCVALNVAESSRTNDAPEIKTEESGASLTGFNVEDFSEDMVLPERLELLRSDSQMSEMLRNPHLRNMVLALDKAQEPAKAIQLAMMEPIFVEFADTCLRIVKPRQT